MKYNLLIILALVLISCSTTKGVTEKQCNSITKNNYNIILEEKFQIVMDNNIISLTEVKYKCVYTALYTKKGMYDRFGKWNQEIYPKGQRHPILLWNNIKLFQNDTTEFMVAANGLESSETIYASILVFDQRNNDLLSDESKYKIKLMEYFSEMIKSNNSEKREFYDVYWKTVHIK